MGIRDEMFRAKVLIFMVPLVLPIGQPPARATDASPEVIECAPPTEIDTPTLTPVILQTAPVAVKPVGVLAQHRPTTSVTPDTP